MTRKALGRGLSALIPEKAASHESESFMELDIDLFEPNAAQPRSHFDEAKLNELAQSIKSNGIVQPLVVRRHGQRFQIVAGERRWRAAQLAGLAKVPAVIRDIPDDKLLELALIENIQRHELNPIEEANAYKRLIETLGLTQELVAQRVGRDRTVITNYLRLLRLPRDLQELVEQEKLSMGHARALLALDTAELQRRTARSIIDGALSVRETERAVKRLALGAGNKNQAIHSPIPKDANVKVAETRLSRRFATKVRITTETNGVSGKIEIEYYSQAELDRIYRMLSGNIESHSLDSSVVAN